MKIVIIREEIIQPDITAEELISKWKELEAIPGAGGVQLQIVDTYPSMEELDELVEDADALFGVWITEGLMSEAFFKKHPKLKYIATLGHGYESFDYAMTRRYGVTVTNTVYGAQTIAEHAFALLMHTCHHIEVQDQRVREIDWSDPGNAPEFCKAVVPQIELYGKTVGVVGTWGDRICVCEDGGGIRHARHFLQPHREAGRGIFLCGAGEFTRGTSCESGCDLPAPPGERQHTRYQ